ncbi:MAG: hypothetical protein RBT42_04600 [Aquabacterium sp.]|jgi:hypothetical protein|uniref:hypothetical protein n=1 Tax=Aquabacterium sp. TaxID=1872578 RepID=UPI002A363739|nr:hypothetical protein [Aquabacterium sp.]MDX9843015.1 hypothetical protein [Aquabacterium sp.]
MISQQAKDGFEFFVTNALKAAVVSSPDDRVDVTALDDHGEIKEERMVLLTVSSYLFRAITMISFTLDAATRSHLAAIHRAPAESMVEADYLDVIGEVGNIFCGAINRDLSHHFPYLGMSTPNVLERQCIDYLDELDASFIRHFRVVVNDGVTFHASLCVCDFADIDFQVDTTVVEESHGELELF